MTFKLALQKIGITAAQAGTAFVLAVIGAQVAGALTAAWALNAFLLTFLVPTVTAAQRLFQAMRSDSEK